MIKITESPYVGTRVSIPVGVGYTDLTSQRMPFDFESASSPIFGTITAVVHSRVYIETEDNRYVCALWRYLYQVCPNCNGKGIDPHGEGQACGLCQP